MSKKCSPKEKKRLSQKDESYHILLILLIGLSGTGVWMLGYSLIWLIASLFEPNDSWIGYFITLIISMFLFILSVFMLKRTFTKRQDILKRMRKCKCKPKDQAFDLI